MLLSAYFDGELTEEESSLVKKHLDNCPDCNNDLCNIKTASNYLKNLDKNTFPSLNDIASIVVNRIFNENKLTCEEVLEEVSAYYDGELTLKLHYLVDEHLRNCKKCRLEYENLVKVSKLIKSAYISKKQSSKYTDKTDL
jgi:predicted anti-sigma-YlaC factor YlaD